MLSSMYSTKNNERYSGNHLAKHCILQHAMVNLYGVCIFNLLCTTETLQIKGAARSLLAVIPPGTLYQLNLVGFPVEFGELGMRYTCTKLP